MFNGGQVAGAVGFGCGGAPPAPLSLQESFGEVCKEHMEHQILFVV